MSWAVALAACAVALLVVVFGFVGELLRYRRNLLERGGRDHDSRLR